VPCLLIVLSLCLVFAGASAVAAQAEAARTLGPKFLGGPGVRQEPKQVGVGAKGVWRRLKWRRWGQKRAYARGVYDIAGFAGEPGTGYRGAIGIRAYSRKRCANGDVVYGRVLYRLRKPVVGKRVFRESFSICR